MRKILVVAASLILLAGCSSSTQENSDGKMAQLIDLPGINETDAVILKEGSTSADEMHVWAINLLINDVWIQVGASFLQNVDEALPIIEAAAESMVK